MNYTFQPVGASTPNFPLLLEALRRVRLLAQANRFDLNKIAEDSACGAICCVVGMALVQEDFPSAGWGFDPDGCLVTPEGQFPGPLWFSNAGADIFKVTEGDAHTLFATVQYDECGKQPTDLEVFEMRLQAFFEHHGQPFPNF